MLYDLHSKLLKSEKGHLLRPMASWAGNWSQPGTRAGAAAATAAASAETSQRLASRGPWLTLWSCACTTFWVRDQIKYLAQSLTQNEGCQHIMLISTVPGRSAARQASTNAAGVRTPAALWEARSDADARNLLRETSQSCCSPGCWRGRWLLCGCCGRRDRCGGGCSVPLASAACSPCSGSAQTLFHRKSCPVSA